jgi:hypothetical protein
LKEIMSVANSIPLWIIAFTVIAIVIFQAVTFLKLASKTAPEIGMTPEEVKTSIKTGFISSLGPSFAIGIVIVSLIALLGSPMTLMRIGIVGSAATEAAAAQIGAKAYGVNLGGADFTIEAFSTVVWTMCVGGLGWLIVTALFTKSLAKTQKAVKKRNPKIMIIVSSAAMLGAFGYLATDQMVKSGNHTVAGIVSVFTMFIVLGISKKTNAVWLKEWALGIVMVVGMISGYLSTLI